MKVFIAWSGAPSKAVALALRQLLKDVVQGPEYFMSQESIPGGMAWQQVIEKELAETAYGILCLTRGNLDSAWMHFEAGAIAKAVGKPRVVPYLVGLEPNDVKQPLAGFQWRQADRPGTLTLIQELAACRDNDDAAAVKRVFDKSWDEYYAVLQDLPPEDGGEKRPTEDMIEETLQLVRRLDRSTSSQRARLAGIGRVAAGLDQADLPGYWYVLPTARRQDSAGHHEVHPALPPGTEGPMVAMGYQDGTVLVVRNAEIPGLPALTTPELRRQCAIRGLNFRRLVARYRLEFGLDESD